MNTLINIFVNKISSYISSLGSGQEYRILIPAPTIDFAECLHQALQDSGKDINSILIISEDEKPDEKKAKNNGKECN